MTHQNPDLKDLRSRLDESQEAFAKRFDTTQATISRWEKDGLPTGLIRKAIDGVIAGIQREVAKREAAQRKISGAA